MGFLLSFLKQRFEQLLGRTLTIDHRGVANTTTASVYVPFPKTVKPKAFDRTVAIKVEQQAMVRNLDLVFGYYDKSMKLVLDRPIFRKPPIVHFDALSEGYGGVAPIVYNISPRGCKVFIAGNPIGSASPTCSVFVTGERILVAPKEKIIFLSFYFILYCIGIGSLVVFLKSKYDFEINFYIYAGTCLLSGGLAFLDYKNNQKISGIL